MDELTQSPPPPRFSIAAYWVRSIERMVAGATAEGVPEDRIYDAVCTAIQEAQMNGDRP
jgi:hypothetical protein